MTKFRAACIQTNAADSVDENIRRIEPMVRQAAADGAQFIALPENAFLMAAGGGFHEQVYAEADHPALAACRAWAAELGIWLLIGSLAIRSDNLSHRERSQRPSAATVDAGEGENHSTISHQPSIENSPHPKSSAPISTSPTGRGKYSNRSYLLAPDGAVAARYDKIHLFDVSIPGGESHRESDRFAHGTEAVVAATPLGRIGLTVCYDVRFPYLYRALAKAGAEILTVPAAFTRFTGEKGGWHVLNRARAMETGCFVIAPAQCGEHAGGRRTYGHSLILDPWGGILAEGDAEPGIIAAEIDLAQVAETRQAMPSLAHDREFTITKSSSPESGQ